MEDNYIDKKFKEILENSPYMTPPPSAVEDMKKRLAAGTVQEKNRLVLPLWWPALLTIPLFLGGLFLFNAYQTLHEKYEAVHLQLSEYQNNSQKDTISNITTIYQIDTVINIIYKDIIVERRYEKTRDFYPKSGYASFLSPNENSLKFGQFGGSAFEKSNFPYFDTWHKNLLSMNKHNYSSGRDNPLIINDENSENKPHPDIPDFKISKYPDGLDYWKLNFLHTNLNSQNLLDKLNQVRLPANKKKNFIRYLRPVGISPGVDFTPYLVVQLPGGDAVGNSFGVHTQINFLKNIALSVGIERTSFNFELKDEAIDNRYPMGQPNDPIDILHELKGNFSYLQIPVTLKKSFRKEKRLQPFLNLGFSGVRPLRQIFKYEYINSTGEYEVTQQFRNGNFSINHLRAGAGSDFFLTKEVSIGLRGYYQYGFNKNSGEYFPLRYWGIQAIATYKW